MAYIYLNNVDFSKYCNKLAVSKEANYNAQTNAAGNTVVDYINHKRTISVGIIPLNESVMKSLQAIIDSFTVKVEFLNPKTGNTESINCIIPDSNVEYYTIQNGKKLFKAFELAFIEL